MKQSCKIKLVKNNTSRSATENEVAKCKFTSLKIKA